jgi:DNA polymerase elongation subunit (family B)
MKLVIFKMKDNYIFPLKWYCTKKGTCEIIIFGWNVKNEPIVCRLANYRPWVYVQFQTGVKITLPLVEEVFNTMHRKVRDLVDYELEERQEVYGHNGPKRILMKLYFNSWSGYNYLTKHLIYNKLKLDNGETIKMTPREHTIPQEIKMMEERDMSHSIWLDIHGAVLITGEDKITRYDDNEYGISYKRLKKCEIDLPLPKPSVVSFDYEVMSINENVFCRSHIPKDNIFMNSNTFRRWNGKEYVYKIVLQCLGNCDKLDPVEIDKKLVDVEIRTYTSEIALLEDQQDMIIEYNPDMVMGYNIFGFDFPYADARLERKKKSWKNISRFKDFTVGMKCDTWGSSGTGHNSMTYPTDPSRLYNDMLRHIKSSFKFPRFTLDYVSKRVLKVGKTTIGDIYKIYKKLIWEVVKPLDNVMNDIYQKTKSVVFMKSWGSGGNYIVEHIVNIRPEDLQDNYDKWPRELRIIVKKYHRMAKLLGTSFHKKFSAKHIFRCRAMGGGDMMKIIGIYCVIDTIRPLELMDKLAVWIDLIENSNVVKMSKFGLFTRGQGPRCLHGLYFEAHRSGYFIGDKAKNKFKFMGAHVFKCKPGMYDNVDCFDYAKLYPSIIMAYNISHDTIVYKVKDPNNKGEMMDDPTVKDDDCHVMEWEEHDEKTGELTGSFHFRYMKKPMGLLPKLLYKLSDGRKAAKWLMFKAGAKADLYDDIVNNYTDIMNRKDLGKLREYITKLMGDDRLKEKILENEYDNIKNVFEQQIKMIDNIEDVDIKSIKEVLPKYEKLKIYYKFMNNVYDIRQQNLKISANSNYGQLGNTMGALPLFEGAACTTAKGRELVKQLAEKVNNGVEIELDGKQVVFYSKIVYGDTDSVMVNTPGIEPERYWEINTKICDEINKMYIKPVELEFEIRYRRYLWLAKKKYATIKANKKDPTFIDEANYSCKGLITIQNTHCEYAKDTAAQVLTYLMTGHDFETIISYIEDRARRLMFGDVSLDDLLLVKGCSGEYKKKNYPMCIYSQYLERRGRPVEKGSKLDYYLVKVEDPKSLMGYRFQHPDLMEEDNSEIDREMYLQKQLFMPLDPFLNAVYGEYLKNYLQKGMLPFIKKRALVIKELKERPFKLKPI